MTDKEILKIINQCAKKYKNNLEKYNIMFIFEEKNDSKELNYIETSFFPWNFMHLTGIKTNKSAVYFYNSALNERISVDDIKNNDKFILENKLCILSNLMKIDYTAKMIGIYDNTIKNKLYTEQVVGTIHYCLGFIKDKNTNYYIPNSSINEDIRDITYKRYSIIAILKKEKNKKLYSEISYLSRNYNLKMLVKNNILSELIDKKLLIEKQDN